MKPGLYQLVLGIVLLNLRLLVHANHARFHQQKHSRHEIEIPAGGSVPARAAESDFESSHMAHDLEKTFSWSDPGLQAMLWEGQEMMPPQSSEQKGIKKRADEPPWWDLKDANGNPLVNANGEPVDASGRRFFGPAYPFKCILCQDKRTNDPALEMSEFTRDKMIARMKKPPRWDLPCIFYSQRPVQVPPLIPPSLSQPATQYACRNSMRSIWMLWPYNPQTCGEENYYCLYDDCCWMAPLLLKGTEAEKQARRLEYFGYMSAAMAATCMDKVWIMTDDLANVPYDARDKPLGDQATGTGWQGRPVDKSIWLNDELPMLRQLWNMGRISQGIWTIAPDGKVGQQVNYILERTTKSKMIREETKPAYNMTALIEVADEERRTWFALPEHIRDKIVKEDDEDRLMKRDSCTGAIDYQPYWEDWFG